MPWELSLSSLETLFLFKVVKPVIPSSEISSGWKAPPLDSSNRKARRLKFKKNEGNVSESYHPTTRRAWIMFIF